MKIEGAGGKNVRSSIFFNFLVKTLGGYFGAQKVDFDDSKSKNGYSPMDSSSFRGKNQNLSQSFHAYQIDAHNYLKVGRCLKIDNYVIIYYVIIRGGG